MDSAALCAAGIIVGRNDGARGVSAELLSLASDGGFTSRG